MKADDAKDDPTKESRDARTGSLIYEIGTQKGKVSASASLRRTCARTSTP